MTDTLYMHRTAAAGRPWKAFVRDIGPTYSFATAERAHARARDLVGDYAEVLVYAVGGDLERWVYRYDREGPRRQVFLDGQWREG